MLPLSDSSDLDGLLIDVLTADTALTAIATDGIWFDVAPPGSRRFVICSLQEAADELEFGDRAYESPLYLVKIVLCNGSGADAKAAQYRIDVDLHGLEATLTPSLLPGYRLMRAERENRIRYLEVDPEAPDLRWSHRGGQYRLYAQPNPGGLALAA